MTGVLVLPAMVEAAESKTETDLVELSRVKELYRDWSGLSGPLRSAVVTASLDIFVFIMGRGRDGTAWFLTHEEVRGIVDGGPSRGS